MTTSLLTLLFVSAAGLAVLSMATTWLRYRDRIAANLAAAGAVGTERSYFVRMVPYIGEQPGLVPGAAHGRRTRRRTRRETIRIAAAVRAAA